MKSVLITGATRNTGFGIARKFASEGWAVFITSRKAEDAKKAAERIHEEFGVPCFGMGFDIADAHNAGKVTDFVHSKGYVLDYLVLCAAAQGLNQNPLTVDIDEWGAVIQANVTGNFSLARTVARDMVETENHGTIVFIGSITYRDCNVLRSAYNASKGAILSITKSLAVDLGQYGIRVNCLLPGPVYTERYDALDEETRRRRNELVPIGRVSTAEDIAGGVWFLASSNSGNATGTGLIIDGGVDSINSGRY